MASSSSVYGGNPVLPKREDLAARPLSPYAASKLATEAYALAYGHSFGLPTMAFRFFNVFGPLQSASHAYAAVVPSFIDAALHGRPLTVHGDGSASRDWLYVDDDAEAIEAAIDADLESVFGQVINVATGVDLSVTEIADLVLEALGKPASLKVHVDERPGQVQRHIGSTEKAAVLLGWSARTPFETGLERTVAWYRDNEAWWRGVRARSVGVYSS